MSRWWAKVGSPASPLQVGGRRRTSATSDMRGARRGNVGEFPECFAGADGGNRRRAAPQSLGPPHETPPLGTATACPPGKGLR
jgi:hypothetical protein